ncbi:MAG: bacteriocin immunity protein, partial [Lactococcus sp.]
LVLDETISQGEREILLATKRRLETDKENGRAIFGLERDLSFYSVNRTLSKSVSEFLTLLMEQYAPSFAASYGEAKN